MQIISVQSVLPSDLSLIDLTFRGTGRSFRHGRMRMGLRTGVKFSSTFSQSPTLNHMNLTSAHRFRFHPIKWPGWMGWSPTTTPSEKLASALYVASSPEVKSCGSEIYRPRVSRPPSRTLHKPGAGVVEHGHHRSQCNSAQGWVRVPVPQWISKNCG